LGASHVLGQGYHWGVLSVREPSPTKGYWPPNAPKGVPSQAFVQLRVPAAHMAFGIATRGAGQSADVLVEGIVRKPQKRAFRSLAILHGVEPERVNALAVELEARYVAASRLETGPQAKIMFEIDHDKLPEGLLGTLIAFQASFGPAWLHFERGKMVARAQALQDSQEAARRLRQSLRLAGIRGTVQVVNLEPAQLAAWQQLTMWRATTMDSTDMVVPSDVFPDSPTTR
jgi:hypothetical protein